MEEVVAPSSYTKDFGFLLAVVTAVISQILLVRYSCFLLLCWSLVYRTMT